MESTAGRRGKIYAMDVAKLGDEVREKRRLQIGQAERHIARAREIVRAFNPQEIEQETNLSDMLCNLMHLCDAEGWDFDTWINRAKLHYTSESGDDPSEWFI